MCGGRFFSFDLHSLLWSFAIVEMRGVHAPGIESSETTLV